MKREKNLAKNTIIITIGKFCTQLITFLLLPLYTGVLTTEEYGIVDLLNTLTSLCLPLVTFQAEQAVFRELIDSRKNDSRKSLIISNGILSIVAQLLVFSLLFIGVSPFVKNDYKYYLYLNVIIHIILSLFMQISRGLGENKKYAFGSFLSGLVTIVLNIVLIAIFRLGAYGMLLGTILGQLISAVYFVVALDIKRYFKIRSYKKEMVRKLWKYSLPLIPDAISWWVFNASDRVIVTSILGVDQNGVLAASLKFSVILTTINSFFNISWIESVSLASKDKDFDAYSNKIINIVMRFFTAATIGMISVMPFVFPLIIKKQFVAGYGLVPISLIAALFDIFVCQVSAVFVAKKDTKTLASTSAIASLLNIAIHLLLIKTIGTYAAVTSTLVSFMFLGVIRALIINKRFFRIKLDYALVFSALPLLLFSLCAYYSRNPYLQIVATIASVFYFLTINKKLVKTIIGQLKNKLFSKKNK